QAISTTNLLEDNVWQSFKANHTGKLESVSIYFANSYLSNILLKVYPGVGISGQELFNHTFTGSSFSSSMQIHELSVSDFSTINLVAGNEYTFQLISVGQDVLLAIDGSNNYLDGTSSISGSTDLKFKVSLEIIEPFTVVVNGIISANQFTGNGIVPAGGIIMWSGSISNIPVGWSLCDGSNGTPDLRDRFIVGAGNSYTVASSGGEAMHTLTIPEMPAHRHTVAKTAYGENSGGRFVSGDNGDQAIDDDALNTSGGDLPHENRPPYYALAYIMKLP
ncbi:MAG: hypothetical protein K9H64_21940, partial [Bacteroidales bacterium]|nr:hypothetical protein [Bacteroidales bacterium]